MNKLRTQTVARAALALVSVLLVIAFLAAAPAMNRAAAQTDDGSGRGTQELSADEVDATQNYTAASEASPRPAKD